MKRFTLILLVGMAFQCLAAAGTAAPLRVVSTLFPWFDFARAISQGQAEVTLLLPPGVEAHTYAPTPRDLRRIEQADVFIYSGPEMEPWVPELLAGLKLQHTRVIDVSASMHLHDAAARPAVGKDHRHPGSGLDPHFWLDPELAGQAVEVIAEGLAGQAPGQAKSLRGQAEVLRQELKRLDAEIARGLRRCQGREVICAGHSAFAYFARRYHLGLRAAYPGYSPNAEPSPRALAELVTVIRKQGVKAVFYEELIDPRVARVLAEETGVLMLPLHGAHNLSAADRDRGRTYLQIMRENLRQLQAGLGCEP
jgi:zinc transport system substrate-binding protein